MLNAIRRLKNAPSKRTSCVLDVVAARRITPNMIRVTLAGPALRDLSETCAGGHCKLMLPSKGQTRFAFEDQFANGPKPVMRTYTIRQARPEAGEIDIDFVAHGDEGPASAWAEAAKPGDFIGFAGPGAPKLTEFDADFYIIVADMSALPVAAAALERLPQDAKGIAIFEVTSDADKQDIAMPANVTPHWLIHPDPHQASRRPLELLENLDWPEGRIRTLVAGEGSLVRSLRMFLRGDKAIDRKHVYAAAYWQIGLAEDAHQKAKRDQVEADETRLSKLSLTVS